MLISIIIPVYKSSRTLVELTHRIDKVFSSIHNSEYEIIFVNDSPFWMETSDTLKKLAAENFRVIAIELTKNFGQQPATLCGIGFAQGELVVTMDDDLQHAPEDIPRLIEKAHHDAVIAKFRSKKHSGFKRFTSKLKGYFDTIVLGKPSSLMLSAFRLFRAPIAKFMLKTNTPYPFIPALLFSITTDVVNVDVEHYERSDGASHYTFGRMFRLFSNLIVNNSSLLLRTVGYTGLVIALLSFIYAVIIAYRALMLEEPLPPIWISIRNS